MVFEMAKYSLIAVATFMLIGGVLGYKKAQSKASLIAGIASFILLGLCFVTTFAFPAAGFIAGIVVLFWLDVVFLLRVFKTRILMPAGMLFLVCVLEQILLAAGLLNLP